VGCINNLEGRYVDAILLGNRFDLRLRADKKRRNQTHSGSVGRSGKRRLVTWVNDRSR
jgi:hypothetical protein